MKKDKPISEKTTKLVKKKLDGKKKVDGKDKGDRYERIIATELQKWSGIELKRSPGSGSWSKKLNCDIVQPQNHSDRKFIFSVECKWNNSFDFNQLFKKPITGPFINWWNQAVNETNSDKITMLVFRVSHIGDFVAVDNSFIDVWNKSILILTGLYTSKTGSVGDIGIVSLEDFKELSYEDLEELYSE